MTLRYSFRNTDQILRVQILFFDYFFIGVPATSEHRKQNSSMKSSNSMATPLFLTLPSSTSTKTLCQHCWIFENLHDFIQLIQANFLIAHPYDSSKLLSARLFILKNDATSFFGWSLFQTLFVSAHDGSPRHKNLSKQVFNFKTQHIVHRTTSCPTRWSQHCIDLFCAWNIVGGFPPQNAGNRSIFQQ